MDIPIEMVILDALSDDDETIKTEIRSALTFFHMDINDEDIIKTLNEMVENKLIRVIGTDSVYGTWFRRTDKGTKMWKDFNWGEYEDFIDARNIELYGE